MIMFLILAHFVNLKNALKIAKSAQFVEKLWMVWISRAYYA